MRRLFLALFPVGFGIFCLTFGSLTIAAPGDLDVTFSSDGKLTDFIPGSGDDRNRAVAIQADGKIVTAGSSFSGSSVDFAVVRYNTDGSLDSTFDGDGKTVTSVGISHDEAYSVAIQGDGKIVAAGYSSGTTYDFAVVRYNTDGSLDTSFDGDGKVVTPVGSVGDQAYSVAVQADGKIVAAGSSYNGTNSDFAVVRYNTDGSLDSSLASAKSEGEPYGSGGKVVIDFGEEDFAFRMALDAVERAVVVGESGRKFAVARVLGDLSTITAVSVGGRVLTPTGQGVRNAILTLTDHDGNVRQARTGSFGYYRFHDVPIGETYTVTVHSKKFVFENSTRVIRVDDELTDVDFIAAEFGGK